MCLWGYSEQNEIYRLSILKPQDLLNKAIPLSNLPLERQQQLLDQELHSFENKRSIANP